ncbi:monofunctional biosynthetic peptidoglycan transglycosylase [Nitrospirales bacterium NOB]|nr:MAG: monofunctional biosynthetic peptidoglycan transglycosylase [Nitrospira sp. OLB3]MBV6468320.1 Biosynthetic peptidoglycan transglycosylase [Nitrospirota bacterium]MCE7963836.1 monofunctional biosynthetic peptidoglycan transglycosylase [Nitrospira sp. NTP2]MDL1889861.1 monofunctional biosynthetic peptidoglycan transglycosylase [Nitrospirales bacterium NOB]MEB2337569.1 monofunctional biosynthetic peptidoglycan transglycosylase [Nitrospirales bacterium]QOJ35504.1 MAG: monofunctional biosynt
MGKSTGSRFGRVLLWFTVLVALPAGAVGAYWLATLPDVAALAQRHPTETALMEARRAQAKEQGRSLRIQYMWMPLSRIAPSLQRAVVAAEDASFFAHEGFDWEGIKDAALYNLEVGEFKRGGSTITQQLAKNLYLSSERSLLRKAREALITRALEHRLTKERILELYLNVAEWGQGVFGAEAAARHHFGKPAKELTVEEAALLAAILPSPRRYDPIRHTAYLNRRQHHIIRWLERRSGRRPHAISNGRRSAESEELSLTQD